MEEIDKKWAFIPVKNGSRKALAAFSLLLCILIVGCPGLFPNPGNEGEGEVVAEGESATTDGEGEGEGSATIEGERHTEGEGEAAPSQVVAEFVLLGFDSREGKDSRLGYGILPQADGEFVIAGFTGRISDIGEGEYDSAQAQLFKRRPNHRGSATWRAFFLERHCASFFALEQTENEGYVVAGGGWIDFVEHPYLCPNERPPVLARASEIGEEIWVRLYGSDVDGGAGEFRAVQQLRNGGFVAAGNIDVEGAPRLFIVKTDADGVEEWSFVRESEIDQIATSVAETADGGLVVTGFSGGSRVSRGTDADAPLFLLRLDGNGNEIWFRTYMDESRSAGSHVIAVSDGDYVVGGAQFDTGSRFVLLKVGDRGELQWSRMYDFGTGDEYLSKMRVAEDGGYVLAGDGPQGSILAKSDSEGNLEWTFLHPTELTLNVTDFRIGSDGAFTLIGNIPALDDYGEPSSEYFSTYVVKLAPSIADAAGS